MTIEALFRSGLEAMAIDLDSEVIGRQLSYLELLAKWNHVHNLTAVRDIKSMVSKHLLDSLAVLPFIGDGRVIDVGSGAGLPGIPLALVKPAQKFTLVESATKRTRFLTQIKIELSLDSVDVVNKRIEDFHPEIYSDVVIARAFAPLEVVLASCRHLFAQSAGNNSSLHPRMLIMQGRYEQSQLTLPTGYRQVAIHRLEIANLDAPRHLLELQPDFITT